MDQNEQRWLASVPSGEERAFERVYELFHQRVRLIAWRVSHRRDWVDDLLNEAWLRAFNQRRSYDPSRPFLVWMAGILRNVYREQCRNSPQTLDEKLQGENPTGRIDDLGPEKLASEAELLAGLNSCLERLDLEDARIVRLRFFDGMTLRAVATEVSVPESTLRDVRLPAVFKALRQCLARKGIEFSEIFSAQGPRGMQYEGEE